MEICDSDVNKTETESKESILNVNNYVSDQCEDIFCMPDETNVQDKCIHQSETNNSIKEKSLEQFESNEKISNIQPLDLNSDDEKIDDSVCECNLNSEKDICDETTNDQVEYSYYVPSSNYILQEEENPFQLCHISRLVDNNQNYIGNCKWSPDGTCFLSVVRGDGMHVMELPSDLYSKTQISKSRPTSILKSAVHVRENCLVYDICWFPGMRSNDPITCCWAATSQHGPVQLWDAFTGELRCSYRGYNLVDEIEAAISIHFSFDGEQLYCGYKKALRTFDVNRPGRDFTYYKMNNSVSCITTSLAQPGLIAIGSWQKTIEFVNDKDDTLRSLTKITGHNGGITHLKFSIDGLRLYSGARKNNEIICWDLRNPGKPLFWLERCSDTNQKIALDLSPCSEWLFSGGLDGVLKIWNVKDDASDNCFEYQLHTDCINSVSVHPYLPIVLTGSGQHHYFSILDEEDIEIIKRIDNSISLWWLGDFDRPQ